MLENFHTFKPEDNTNSTEHFRLPVRKLNEKIKGIKYVHKFTCPLMTTYVGGTKGEVISKLSICSMFFGKYI
jgi:hypothetical protein